MPPKVARGRRYVFSEMTPIGELLAGNALEMLAARNVTLYVAITPPRRAQALSMVRACRDRGVTVGLWPMIADDAGRWASAWTGVEYTRYARGLLDELAAAGAMPDEFLVDLEPPYHVTGRVLRARWRRGDWLARPEASGARELVDWLREASGSGVRLSATVPPWAVCGRGRRGWQRMMGTPVEGMPFDRVFIMAYTSLLEGYSRGLLSRRDAEALLASWTRGAIAHLGPRAAVAVGVIGVGALGDERCYRAPAELARDVSIAVYAGCADIALFNLGGALGRPPADRWLDALAVGPASATPRTLRASVTSRALSATGVLAEWILERRTTRRPRATGARWWRAP